MPQTKPGIATTILAPDFMGEGFTEISPNKTLFIHKLTTDDAISPQIVEGLQTVEDVFAHYKPSCDVELDREDGSTTNETFNFGNLSDFDVKNLVAKSGFLKTADFEHDIYLRIIKQLNTNKALKKVIENPEARQAFINVLESLNADLEV